MVEWTSKYTMSISTGCALADRVSRAATPVNPHIAYKRQHTWRHTGRRDTVAQTWCSNYINNHYVSTMRKILIVSVAQTCPVVCISTEACDVARASHRVAVHYGGALLYAGVWHSVSALVPTSKKIQSLSCAQVLQQLVWQKQHHAPSVHRWLP